MTAAQPLWSGADIARAAGGSLSVPFVVSGVTFDSREVTPGDLFIALRGASSDGHDFVSGAHEAGASGFVVERPVPFPHVLVSDTPAALNALGGAARRRTSATIIGVTGSVGKTGTKEALRLALDRIAPGRTHASVKSYNNHTGVPLSLARMPAESRFGIFEMGMNHAGELAALTRLVRPHIGVVTWVAPAHIEHFNSVDDIARAKSEIFEGIEPGGTAIWPHDNPHAAILSAAVAERGLLSLSFGLEDGADVRAFNVVTDWQGSSMDVDVAGERLHCRIGMAGSHWVSNALAVLAAVKATGADIGEAAAALEGMTGIAGRGARFTIPASGGEALLIDESYNANPASMAAALAVLADIPGRRRIAVLGAMRELGRESAGQHAALAAPINAASVAELALVGPEMTVLAIDGASHLPDWQAAGAWVKATLQAGDVLLVKGSNSVGLGRLVDLLKGPR